MRWLQTDGLGEDFVPDVRAERFRSADVDGDAEDFFGAVCPVTESSGHGRTGARPASALWGRRQMASVLRRCLNAMKPGRIGSQ